MSTPLTWNFNQISVTSLRLILVIRGFFQHVIHQQDLNIPLQKIQTLPKVSVPVIMKNTAAEQQVVQRPRWWRSNPVSVLETGGLLIPETTTANFYTIRTHLTGNLISRKTLFRHTAGTEFRRKVYTDTEFTGWGFERFQRRNAYPDYRAIKVIYDWCKAYTVRMNSSTMMLHFTELSLSYKTLYNLSLSIRLMVQTGWENHKGSVSPYMGCWDKLNIHEQNFLKEFKFIDILKLRASYGLRVMWAV